MFTSFFPLQWNLIFSTEENREPYVFFPLAVLGDIKQNCPAEEIQAGSGGTAWEHGNGTGEPTAIALSTWTTAIFQPDPNQVERVERKQSCQQAGTSNTTPRRKGRFCRRRQACFLDVF